MNKSGKKCRFRLFGTTADVGLSVCAEELNDLFSCAGKALFSAICDRRRVRSKVKRRLRITEENLEFMMVAWLNELIYIWDTDGFLLRNCVVELEGESALNAVISGEHYNLKRHPLDTIFKAATYHQLKVKRLGNRWHAKVIMDV